MTITKSCNTIDGFQHLCVFFPAASATPSSSVGMATPNPNLSSIEVEQMLRENIRRKYHDIKQVSILFKLLKLDVNNHSERMMHDLIKYLLMAVEGEDIL